MSKGANMYKTTMVTLTVIFMLATPALTILGIWAEDDRFAYMAVVSFLLTAAAFAEQVGE